MARYIERGETLFIPFYNGKSLTESQLRPRMYKTMQALENSLHFKEGYEVAEYVEQKHGRWEKWWCEDYITYFHRCSVCGEDALTKEETAHDEVLSNYCPNCGAKMDGN